MDDGIKFLIFGTGRAALRIMRACYYDYFEHGNNSILAFVDNNIEKIGAVFLDRPIISPSDIDKYDYDYIVICSTFEEEIKEQLIYELGCKPDCIVSFIDMNNDLRGYYFNEKLGMRSQKVVYVACTEEMKITIDKIVPMQLYFNEVPEVVMFNEVLKLDMSKYDYIFIDDVYGLKDFYIERDPMLSEKNLIMYLTENLNISSDRILQGKTFEFLLFNYADRNESWGEENPDKIFYVIRILYTCSIIQMAQHVIHVCDYARRKGYIPVVDGLTHTTAMHENNEIGKINVWEKFFEQPASYNMSDIQYSKNVILSCRIYGPCDTKQAYKSIVMKPKLKEILDNFGLRLKKYKKVLGVHYRGTDYNNGRYALHPIQPSIKQMVSVVMEKIDKWNKIDGEEFDCIFLCTESEEAVKAFCQNFGSMVIVQDLERWPSDCTYTTMYAEKNFVSKYDWAAGYWVDIITLSKCHSLITCLCAGQAEAENYNEACYENDVPYAHIYHVCNGIQGIDD